MTALLSNPYERYGFSEELQLGNAVQGLRDTFGRNVTYLRLSVTDRCDLRCSYCMAEQMTFLPKRDVLSLEELTQLSNRFIDRGVKKLRITGGEPLVRRDIMTLFRQLSPRLNDGSLDELTLTTNATQLKRYATDLKSVGVRRINVSLDTLDPVRFAKITRRDQLSEVLAGIEAALAAGLHIKINAVALKDSWQADIPALIEWSHQRGIDVTLIEVMPLGEIGEDRFDQYVPLSEVVDALREHWTLTSSDHNTGGPARYFNIEQTKGRLGVITPLTNNFCAGCNRVRVTCTGRIYTCLGSSDYLDLRSALRGQNPAADLDRLLDQAMMAKPERHHFDISSPRLEPAVARHMSVTGG